MSSKRRFADYSRAAILAAQAFNHPTANPPDQSGIAQSLADRLGYDLDFTLTSTVQARLATLAMLERQEIKQHGRILRLKVGGEK